MTSKVRQIRSLPFLKATGILFLLIGFSALLLLARIGKTEKVTYYFLFFNIFLALVPLALAYFLRLFFLNQVQKPLAVLLLAMWLIFLPNAPYIVTDFVHVRPRHGIPIWYDIMIMFGFASGGLLSGFISLRIVQKMIDFQFGLYTSWLAVVASLLASGYAIYIGRFLRWHSWHIVTKPGGFFAIVWQHAMNPIDHFHVFKITLVIFTFLMVFYLFLLNFNQYEG